MADQKNPVSGQGAGSGDAPTVDRRGVIGTPEGERKRRRVIRHVCDAAIRMLTGRTAEDGDYTSRVLDISMEGAALFTQVHTEQPFRLDEELHIGIRLADGSIIQTIGRVRWVREVPEREGYAAGVHFVHVDPSAKSRIQQFLKELDATLGI